MPYQLGHMRLEQGLAYYNVLRDGETEDPLHEPNDLKEEERQIAHLLVFLASMLGDFHRRLHQGRHRLLKVCSLN